jgi:hypothetical protein
MAPKTTKRGKENAPVKKFVDESDVEGTQFSFPLVADITESDVPVLKKVKKTKDVDPLSSSSRPSEKDKDAGSLQKRLAAMTAERDRAVAERKEVAAQFEELSQLRASEAETLLEKFKKQTAAVAKGECAARFFVLPLRS